MRKGQKIGENSSPAGLLVQLPRQARGLYCIVMKLISVLNEKATNLIYARCLLKPTLIHVENFTAPLHEAMKGGYKLSIYLRSCWESMLAFVTVTDTN